MANYFDAYFKVSFIAVDDLSTKQYFPVALASNAGGTLGVASSTASAPTPVGVLVNDPCAGQEATVVVFGFTKARARATSSCWLTWGRGLRSASDGFEPVAASPANPGLMGRWFGPAVTTAGASVIGNVLVSGPNACSVELG